MGSKDAQRRYKRKIEMYAEQDGACYLCGETMLDPSSTEQLKDHCLYPEFEHVTPKSKGGTNDMNNLLLACRSCNQSKRDLMPLDITTPEGRDRALGLHMFIASMATLTPLRRVL